MCDIEARRKNLESVPLSEEKGRQLALISYQTI